MIPVSSSYFLTAAIAIQTSLTQFAPIGAENFTSFSQDYVCQFIDCSVPKVNLSTSSTCNATHFKISQKWMAIKTWLPHRFNGNFYNLLSRRVDRSCQSLTMHYDPTSHSKSLVLQASCNNVIKQPYVVQRRLSIETDPSTGQWRCFTPIRLPQNFPKRCDIFGRDKFQIRFRKDGRMEIENWTDMSQDQSSITFILAADGSRVDVECECQAFQNLRAHIDSCVGSDLDSKFILSVGAMLVIVASFVVISVRLVGTCLEAETNVDH